MGDSSRRTRVGYRPGLFNDAASAGTLLGIAQAGLGLPLLLYAVFGAPLIGPAQVFLGIAAISVLVTGALTYLLRRRMHVLWRHVVLCGIGVLSLACQFVTSGQAITFTFAWTSTLLVLLAFAVIPTVHALAYPAVFIPLSLLFLALEPGANPADVAMSSILMLATAVGLSLFARSAITSETDPLTGIRNFAGFLHVLGVAMEETTPSEPLTVVRLDIMDFALINRRGGRKAGDAALIGFVAAFVSALPSRATFARVEGDAFAILLPDHTAARAQDWLDSVQSRALAFSAGIATRDAIESESELFGRAGKALLQAQVNGGGKVATHAGYYASPAAVRDGLANGEFFVLFQPVVELDTETAVGAEALVRWQHPTRGLIPPVEFIPLCEASGSIHVLGRWVLREAIASASTWAGVRHRLDQAASVSVNASARELATSGYASYVLTECSRVDFSPSRLSIEVTETDFGSDTTAVHDNIRMLRAAGVQISIDDFGTGHSSLARLTEIELDLIKIDKAFIDVIDATTDSPVADLTIRLAAALELGVVAEGVETEAQATWLRERGCQRAQGFLYSPPLRSAEFEDRFLGEASAALR